MVMKTSFKLNGFTMEVSDDVDVKIESVETSFDGTPLEVIEQVKATAEIVKSTMGACTCDCSE